MGNLNPSHEHGADDGLGRLVRRVLSPGPAPEERLEELLAARRRELEEMVRCADAGENPDALAPMQGWRRRTIGDRLWQAVTGGA